MLAGSVPAAAQLVQQLPGATADGRYFSHLPYAQIPDELRQTIALTDPRGKSCDLHRDVANALYRLTDAARAAGIALWPISCFRSIARQQALFCGAGVIGQCRDPADRARSSAPGGYSEHATGYALDFGTSAPTGCNDLDPCMSGTPGGLWLRDNATRYGFELSFPPGNKQGVTWEPWHWRWVGATADDPGAAAARRVFARARAIYPAQPGIAESPPRTSSPIDPRHFTGPRD